MFSLIFITLCDMNLLQSFSVDAVNYIINIFWTHITKLQNQGICHNKDHNILWLESALDYTVMGCVDNVWSYKFAVKFKFFEQIVVRVIWGCAFPSIKYFSIALIVLYPLISPKHSNFDINHFNCKLTQ